MNDLQLDDIESESDDESEYNYTATFTTVNQLFAYAKTKAQISCAVTAQLISAFVFAIRIIQSLYYLNLKFQASSHLLWLYSPVYLRSPYLIIISAICHCHSFKNELVLVLNTAWRKQPIADYVSNHNRTCGESVSENSE